MPRSTVRLSTRLLLSAAAALATAAIAFAEPNPGLTLISPSDSRDSYLMELDGTVLTTWHGHGRAAHIAYLLEDGSILRPSKDRDGLFITGGTGGVIERIDANDVVIWQYWFSTAQYQQHHDIEPLPNGNVLILAWELVSHEDAIAAGRVDLPGPMWPTLIVEVEPVLPDGGNIVWEWHLWDHIVQDVDPAKPAYGQIADHPELLDVNAGDIVIGDWIHANALGYHPELDQIVISSNKLGEIYVIDHSTTTAEAAGHTGGNSGKGGDLLYRWGNPEIYGRGDATDRYYFGVHGVNWIPAGLPGEGRLLTFNNGNREGAANDYSSVESIETPLLPDGNYLIEPGEPYGPAAPAWSFSDPAWFYADHLGGAFRMPNGNTLISEGPQRFLFEVDEFGVIVWDYVPPGSLVRAQRYPSQETAVQAQAGPGGEFAAWPNPTRSGTTFRFTSSGGEEASDLEIFDCLGRRVRALRAQGPGSVELHWDGRDERGMLLPSGVYLARVGAGDARQTRRILLLR